MISIQLSIMALSAKSAISHSFTDARMFSASPTHKTLRLLVTSTLAIDYWMGNGFTLFFCFIFTNFMAHWLCIILFSWYKNCFSTHINHKWINFCAFGAAWFGSLHTAMAETVNYIISRSIFCPPSSSYFSLYSPLSQKREMVLYLSLNACHHVAKETAPMLIVLLFFYFCFLKRTCSIMTCFKKVISKQLWKRLFICCRLHQSFCCFSFIHYPAPLPM